MHKKGCSAAARGPFPRGPHPAGGPLLKRSILAAALAGLTACGGGGGGDGGPNLRPDPPPQAPAPTTPSPVVNPPNPAYSKHLAVTNTAAAHAAGFNGAGVRIGVVDTGVNRKHPALSPRVVENLVYVGRGNDLSVDDKDGHGTAVSQIMAGTAFGSWPGGIAPGAQIVSARIVSDNPPPDDGSGQGNEVDGAIGLKPVHQDLIARGVKVMNNSWGGLYWTNLNATAPIADEYRPFIIGNGGLVVFATGNEGRPDPSSMAALPSQPGPNGSMPGADLERGWLAVTAVDPDNPNQLDRGSDGRVYANACGVAMRYCLAAPGTVVTTGTDDAPTSPTYWNWKGTSLAAPQVSGAAALVWQAFPFFTNDNVRQTLLGTAADLGAAGIDAVFGNGLLDVGKAVRGPGRLDFGTFDVSFDDATVTFANELSGPGGLRKGGTGTLVLANAALYQGETAVDGGVLKVNQLGGRATIAPQGELQLGANASGGIDNAGRLILQGANPQIQGAYRQAGTGVLGYTIGSPLTVTGTARLEGGDLLVMGVRSGYTWQSRETVLSATAGLTGTFGRLTTSPGVFLDATLGYDATVAWLDIARLDVAATARSMGLSTASVSGAERVEDAFSAIDRSQRDGQATPVDGGFLAAAGAIQRAPDAAAAERTLASLSGELHTADAAMAMMAIEGNRRALEARVDELQAAPRAGGAWADELRTQRASSGYDMDADGWMLGQDVRYGEHLTVGTALARTDAYAWHDLRGDRERNRQVEGQLYAAWDLGRGYLLGNLAFGRMQRWTRRELLLGDAAFYVGSDYADDYAVAGLQAGLPLRFAGGRATPYLGVQTLRLERDGFDEQGGLGFGLSAADSRLQASQALLGARVAYDWSAGAVLWSLQGRAEWQRLLAQSGTDLDARFTALEVWSPIRGAGLDENVGVLGLGLNARFGDHQLGFDLDGRREFGRSYGRAMAYWSLGF
ncbi:autotransporter serine protease [Vulcaniibacterium tengchongense]|uniref:Autotransporter-associated beta strand protein n=1 Tax=Vulcaniibacterium tengchongense TaxID=1273429 RepID=A0A3N4W9P3_9GAMM|nr:autotransporter serine protease [Vulcaniibacterium tengchongense]RPE81974.1 autotransporter-associated beta strand protein [Vulcaniibacterium tengchongense]